MMVRTSNLNVFKIQHKWIWHPNDSDVSAATIWTLGHSSPSFTELIKVSALFCKHTYAIISVTGPMITTSECHLLTGQWQSSVHSRFISCHNLGMSCHSYLHLHLYQGSNFWTDWLRIRWFQTSQYWTF